MRARDVVLAAIVAASISALSSCSHGNDYYDKAPYSSPTAINPDLAVAEAELVGLLAASDTQRILDDRTAPPWRKHMAAFLHGYAGHPAVLAGMHPSDDNTAEEVLTVTCTPTSPPQRVILAWGWFDGDWRAWPGYAITASGKAVSYPGC